MIFCERAFTAKDSLNKHITIHDKVKLLKCKICGTHFSFPCDMKNHISRVHEGKKLWVWGTCECRGHVGVGDMRVSGTCILGDLCA